MRTATDILEATDHRLRIMECLTSVSDQTKRLKELWAFYVGPVGHPSTY